MWLARFALGLLILLVAMGPAFAQDEVATVRLDGQAVFQVSPTSDADDAAVHARRIEARLSGLLRNLNALAPPVARQTSAGWSVNVSGIPVVTVTPRDAEDNPRHGRDKQPAELVLIESEVLDDESWRRRHV